MNRLKRFFICSYSVTVCVALLSACAQSMAGFENFKGFNSRAVGSPLTDRLVTGGRSPISVVRLINGNDEYRYLLYKASVGRPPCIMIYEVDPKTEIVVRSSYIGDEKGCVIVP